MRAEHTGENKWSTRFGLMVCAPALVMVGAVSILILSTPVMLALMVIVFATVLLWAGTVVTRQAPVTDNPGKEGAVCESVDMNATLEPETVEMVEALTDAPRTAVTAAITKVEGPCPLGLMPGNTWEIGPDGKLSRPMCRRGAIALSSLFRMANGNYMDQSACCECVIAGQEVTFTVRGPVHDPV